MTAWRVPQAGTQRRLEHRHGAGEPTAQKTEKDSARPEPPRAARFSQFCLHAVVHCLQAIDMLAGIAPWCEVRGMESNWSEGRTTCGSATRHRSIFFSQLSKAVMRVARARQGQDAIMSRALQSANVDDDGLQ